MKFTSRERIALYSSIELSIKHIKNQIEEIGFRVKVEQNKYERKFLRQMKKIAKEEIEILKKLKEKIEGFK
jgi:tRNA C32,U32 (ribose-2'-O)-methylase TrmJ